MQPPAASLLSGKICLFQIPFERSGRLRMYSVATFRNRFIVLKWQSRAYQRYNVIKGK